MDGVETTCVRKIRPIQSLMIEGIIMFPLAFASYKVKNNPCSNHSCSDLITAELLHGLWNLKYDPLMFSTDTYYVNSLWQCSSFWWKFYLPTEIPCISLRFTLYSRTYTWWLYSFSKIKNNNSCIFCGHPKVKDLLSSKFTQKE